jgi:predicted nucleotidyltransferase
LKTLTRDDIIRAFETLARQIGASEPPHELIIAGGAALVILYGARESTKDVDAVRFDLTVREAARCVADLLGLPDDWLNDGAKGYLQGLTRGEVVFRAPGLLVRTLALPQLLAMKLSAWRDDLDIADGRLLLSKIQGDKEQTWRLIEPRLVPGRELKARYAFEDLWEDLHGTD